MNTNTYHPIVYEPLKTFIMWLVTREEVNSDGGQIDKESKKNYLKMIEVRLYSFNNQRLNVSHFIDLWSSLKMLVSLPQEVIWKIASKHCLNVDLVEGEVPDGQTEESVLEDKYKLFLKQVIELAKEEKV